jgi:3'-5' exoribonuclease-like protein
MPNNPKTKYYYDTEFLDDGNTINLISIGIVCEDGREYYAVNKEADWVRILQNKFLMENVVPHLPVLPDSEWFNNGTYAFILDEDDPSVKAYSQIADEVHEFLLADDCGLKRTARELWAWYGAYDHVALSQLYGTMIGLPEGIPMHTCDLKQEFDRLGSPSHPAQSKETAHNALHDAKYNHFLANFLRQYEARRLSEVSQRVLCCSFDIDEAHELLDAVSDWRPSNKRA